MSETKNDNPVTGLVKVTDIFAPMIERQLTGNGVKMDGYSKQCVINAISSINAVLEVKGIEWKDPQLDRNNITQTLLNVAALKLNAAASPREVFFQVRNVRVKDPDGKDVYKKQIEMGIEGDGNDAILSRFGRGIKKVGQFWLVRENDPFEYPKYNGIELQPPTWSPTGSGEVIRIVYPIVKDDDTVEYHISERADVARNLLAHINNNMMNETFGICENRYKATPAQKKEIDKRKMELLKRAKELGLDSLDDPDLQQWISPAWTEFHSREAMLIRKMRNNIVKKIPKDFGNAFVEMLHAETTDETYAAVRKEISENANGEVIDVKAEVSDPQAQEQSESQQEDPERHDPVEENQEPSGEGQQELDIEQPAATGPKF